MRASLAAGRPACQVNPFKLRQFARASGVLVKNDPLDMRMIASFVASMPTRPAQPRPPSIERLAEMPAVRRQLNAEKVAAENAARLLEDAMLQRLSRRRIARLPADIDMLERHLVEIVETDTALAHPYRLLTSLPGVGLVLACTLMALVGVAPYAFESGKFKGRRCIWGSGMRGPHVRFCERRGGAILCAYSTRDQINQRSACDKITVA
jgi:transposase